jgi:transforming growth factor-beta-induced protein
VKRYHVFSVFVLLALVLSACTPAATSTPAVPVTASTATTAPMPTTAPTATAEPAAAPQTIVDVAVADGRFTTLAAALQAAGLVETLQGEGPFTVFAPTDDAFAKLPAGTVEELLKPENIDQLAAILTYHVVPGKVMAADVAGLSEAATVQGENIAIKTDMGKVMINEAEVVLADVAASNGVIHVIDSVLLPPSTQAAAESDEMAELDIVDTAVANGSFTTLAAALEAAGLIETLKGEGPFTVFAPTDEAFAKLPAGTVENLLKPENKDQLIAILTYHVVAGKVMAADVVQLSEAETVQGGKVTIKTDMDKVMINDATVVIADVAASNGVIHVIDTVILPPTE